MAKLLLLVVSALLATLGSHSEVDGANILFFFAGGSYSHKISIWPFACALADRGHNVTFLSSYDRKPYEHPAVVHFAPKTVVQLMSSTFAVDRLADRRENREWLHFANLFDVTYKTCAKLLQSQDDAPLNNLIYNGTFDLVITSCGMSDCGLAVAHHLGAKYIIFDSSLIMPWYYDLYGAPTETSWIPEQMEKFGFPMNIYERVKNYFWPLYFYHFRQSNLYPRMETLMKEAFKIDGAPPSMLEIERNASLVFINSHHATDFPRSLPPMFVNIGGMQCWQELKPIPEPFKSFLDGATNGAILMSFGSTIDLSKIPQQYKTIFFEMVRKFPSVRFVWRWDGPLPADAPSNLLASKWLPQFEILSHPNIKGFISHGGLNSLTESTCHGVPVIIVPLFADQDFNGFRVEAQEIGVRVEVRDLNVKHMQEAVDNILTDAKYGKNMKKKSLLLRDRPQSPIDSAIYWTEFVLRHEDTESLKPMAQLGWFQRRMFDVLLLLLALSSLLVVGVYKVVTVTLDKASGAKSVKVGRKKID